LRTEKNVREIVTKSERFYRTVLTNVKYTAIINPCFISDVFLRRTKTKQAAMNGIKLILEILAENRRVVRVGRMRGGDITRELSR